MPSACWPTTSASNTCACSCRRRARIRTPRSPRRQRLRSKELGTRLAETSGTVAMGSRGGSGSHADLARSVPMDEEEAKAMLHQVEQGGSALKLDISTLRTGDMLEGRYKYIEKHRQGRLRHRAADGRHGGR